MKAKISLFIMLVNLFALFSYADQSSDDVQSIVQQNYNTCYELDSNLAKCQPYNCTMKAINANNEWSANSVIGVEGDQCYMMYYLYNDQTAFQPQYCYFTQDNIELYLGLMTGVKSATSMDQVSSYESRISNLLNTICTPNKQLNNEK
jgi:hypothetical protein